MFGWEAHGVRALALGLLGFAVPSTPISIGRGAHQPAPAAAGNAEGDRGGQAAWTVKHPTLELIQTAPVPMTFPTDRTAFEGGTLLRTASGLHLFTTDITHGIVNTSLVYYHAAGSADNFTFVRRLSCCSSGAAGDPKGSLWAPMPAWDDASQHWQLFYVQYRAYGPGLSTEALHPRPILPSFPVLARARPRPVFGARKYGC